MVLKVLNPIWLAKAPTAKRVRERIEAILEWSKVQGHRKGENPARFKGHLALMLPRQTHRTEHRKALPYADVAGFMAALGREDGTGARALELAVLTALRTTEVLGAQWSEIDLAKRVWTVPAERMKMTREHRVPLSDSALAALKEMAKTKAGPFVFPAMRGGTSKPISDKAMRQALKDMGRTDIDPHGFRSTFRDWASETTDHDGNTVEMALAHAIKSDVEKAYRRGDLFEKRRALMTDWADYCAGRTQEGGKVVPIRGRQ
jgi:integrase